MAESVKTPSLMTAREFVTWPRVMAHSAKVALAFLVEPVQGEVVSVRSADRGGSRLEPIPDRLFCELRLREVMCN
jgi:hypothetical protein